MEMDLARYDSMVAQRFDPLRHTSTSTRPVSLFKNGASKLTTGQDLYVRTHPCVCFPVQAGAWLDHEVTASPLQEGGYDPEASCSSTPSSTSNFTTDTRTSSPTPVDVSPSHTQQIDVYDRDDVVVTRTIVRPHCNPTRTPSCMQMVLAWMFSCLPSPTTTTHSPPPSPYSSSSALLPRSTLPSRPTSPVLQSLNCFSTSSAFDSDVDDMPMNRRERPFLQVIVTETRERYEDDKAFKKIVGSIYPGPVAVAALRSGGV